MPDDPNIPTPVKDPRPDATSPRPNPPAAAAAVLPRPDNTPPPAAPTMAQPALSDASNAATAARNYRVGYGSTVPLAQDTRWETAGSENALKNESMGVRIYHGVLGALAGTKDVAVTGYDQKGNPIYSTTQLGPGQQWKKIIAGAITGLAAGAGEMGPGAAGRAFSKGFQGAQGQEQQRQTLQRQQAQQSFENQQKAAMTGAQTSMLTNQAAEIAFRTTRMGVEAAQSDIDRMNKFHDMIASGGEGSHMIGHYRSMDDVTAAFRADPSLHDSHAQGQIVAVPHVDEQTGKIDGVDAAYVTKDWFNAQTDKAMTIQTTRTVDGKVEDVEFTVPARGMTNGQWLQLTMAQAKDGLDLKLKSAQVTGTEAETKEREAGTKQKGAETDLTQYELDYARTHDGTLPGKKSGAEQRQEDQEKEWGPGGYVQGFKPWHKEMVEPVLATEKSFTLADNAYKDFKTAQAAGKRLPTGAQSMLLLSQHIQNTFGTVKGGRVTKDMIHEHLGARDISDSMLVAVQKLYNGDVLAPDQWEAFHQLIGEAREAGWQEVIADAHAAGHPLNKVPVPADMLQKYGRPGDEQPQAPNRVAQARQAMAATPGPGTATTPTATPGGGTAPPPKPNIANKPAGSDGNVVLNKATNKWHWTNAQHQDLGEAK